MPKVTDRSIYKLLRLLVYTVELSVEGGLLECCLQRRVGRRLLERDPFQCSVECVGERLLL